MGGFCIEISGAPGQTGAHAPIQFALDLQGFAVSFPATLEVVRRDANSLAARFVDLGAHESELLQQFVSAIVSGQMTSVNGVLKHIHRPVTKWPCRP